MKKILIAEDIAHVREALKSLLAHIKLPVQVVAEAETVDQAYHMVLQHDPDILFLDIQLRGGTGFDLLHRLKDSAFLRQYVIFLTAYGTFDNLLRALHFAALDFLVKPIDQEKLETALKKCFTSEHRPFHLRQMDILLDNLHESGRLPSKIGLHGARGSIQFEKVDDIIYLRADTSSTYFHLTGERTFHAVKNIGFYSRLLTQQYAFYPISQSIIVNIDYVQRFNPAEKSLKLTNGEVLYASRRGATRFRDWWGR